MFQPQLVSDFQILLIWSCGMVLGVAIGLIIRDFQAARLQKHKEKRALEYKAAMAELDEQKD